MYPAAMNAAAAAAAAARHPVSITTVSKVTPEY